MLIFSENIKTVNLTNLSDLVIVLVPEWGAGWTGLVGLLFCLDLFFLFCVDFVESYSAMLVRLYFYFLSFSSNLLQTQKKNNPSKYKNCLSQTVLVSNIIVFINIFSFLKK